MPPTNQSRLQHITLCGRTLDTITTAAPSFVEYHDCRHCAQQAHEKGYSLP